MSWWEMPESTEEEKARKEMEECRHCIAQTVGVMQRMGVPEKEWKSNVMIKEYMRRMEEADKILRQKSRL